MSGAHLFGWEPVSKKWVKLQCNEAGKLVIDPSEIFENIPTDNEHGKAPDSDWAYDHENDASAHHARYTDAESRAAIGNLFNAVSYLQKDLFCNYFSVNYLSQFILRKSGADEYYIRFEKPLNHNYLRFACYKFGTGYVPCYFYIFNGTADEKVATEPVVDSKINTHAAIESVHHTKFTIAEHDTPDRHALANLDPLVCSEAEADSKIATHKADASAHHARYTDAEAIAAVGYNGTKYWSCPGVMFTSLNPATDNTHRMTDGDIYAASDGITFVCPVLLPHGATVTSCIVYGNANAEDKTWYLRRIKLSDLTPAAMASANINTADDTISSGVIDNSQYGYFIYTNAFETNDNIFGVSITYTV